MSTKATTIRLDLISIERAAKLYHMRREHALEIANEAEIAIPIGRKQLRVHQPDFERAILARRGKKRRRTNAEPTKFKTCATTLNPRVRC